MAYRRSGIALDNYGASSNNNDFYAGVPAANRLIFFDGTNSDQTLAAYQARVATRDSASVTLDPLFLSTTCGSATFLHINPAGAGALESGGANVAGITDDFDGDIRQGNPGYTGTGTAPDIGADEFGSVITTPTPTPTITPTPPPITPTPTPTATVSPTVTPTATPTVTPTATPTVTPGPTCTPVIIAEAEPNNTFGTAQVLTLVNGRAIVQAAINPIADADFYRVDGVPAGARVWFATDTGGTLVAGDRDTIVNVLAADGTTVIENDDDDGTGNGGDGTEESNAASSVAGRTLVTGGTYFLQVNHFDDTVVVNPYRLFVVITNTAATPEVEANDTPATANTLITSGQPTAIRSGVISTAGDLDFYSVDLAAGSNLFVSVDGDPARTGVNTLDGVVELFAPNGITMLIAADSGFGGANNSEAVNFNITTAGIYFVKVRGFSTEGSTPRAYNIMASTNTCVVATPTPSPSATPTPSPSATVTPTPSPTATVSPTVTPTATATVTPTATVSPSATPCFLAEIEPNNTNTTPHVALYFQPGGTAGRHHTGR